VLEEMVAAETEIEAQRCECSSVRDLRMTPEKIKGLRTSRGLSQYEFAKLLGVSRMRITHWECGENSPNQDGLAKLTKLANELNDEN
jgi:DNA-binding transcriptional regulator YiaG